MSNIIYLGSFRFPDKDAASKRVYSIGCILRDLGHTVVFVGGAQAENSVKKMKYKNFTYYNVGELDKGNKNTLDKVISFLKSGDMTIEWLGKYIKNHQINKIIAYNSSYIFLNKVYNFCEKNNIEFICDITEWYDSTHLPGGKLGIVAIDNAIKMYKFYPKVNKRIVISSYLKNYYNHNQSLNIIVPPLITELNELKTKDIKNEVNILYAGNPGKKDNIYTLLKVYFEHKKKLPNLSFHLIGITKLEFERQYSIDVSGKVKFYGNVPYSKVIEVYSYIHFSFFVREYKRYADAGFPTKFVESMSQSTPVITNLTSDIQNYLEDGRNGYILRDLTEDSILSVLIKLNKLTNKDYNAMQSYALATSIRFDYKLYIESLNKFLTE